MSTCFHMSTNVYLYVHVHIVHHVCSKIILEALYQVTGMGNKSLEQLNHCVLSLTKLKSWKT